MIESDFKHVDWMMKLIWNGTCCGVIAGTITLALAGQARNYCYVSPKILKLDNVTIRWPIEDGWRLTTNAEGPSFRANTMTLRFQKFDQTHYKTVEVSGVFNFVTAKMLARRPELHQMKLTNRVFVTTPSSKGNAEMIYRVGGQGYAWAKIIRLPAAQMEFWRRQLQQVLWVDSSGRPKKL